MPPGRYVGYLLGLTPDALSLIANYHSARYVGEVVALRQLSPDEDSAKLTGYSLQAVETHYPVLSKAPKPLRSVLSCTSPFDLRFVVSFRAVTGSGPGDRARHDIDITCSLVSVVPWQCTCRCDERSQARWHHYHNCMGVCSSPPPFGSFPLPVLPALQADLDRNECTTHLEISDAHGGPRRSTKAEFRVRNSRARSASTMLSRPLDLCNVSAGSLPTGFRGASR